MMMLSFALDPQVNDEKSGKKNDNFHPKTMDFVVKMSDFCIKHSMDGSFGRRSVFI